MKSQQLYKKRYVIAFYEKDDDTLKYLFNNVEQVCKAAGFEVNSHNMNKISVWLYDSLKRDDHRSKVFREQNLRVYILDVTDDEDDMNENERSEL